MYARDPRAFTWRKSSYSSANANCVEVGWHKSSYSTDQSNCVEVGWRKSSYSSDNANCVEVADDGRRVGVRDTKDRTAGHLTITPNAWRLFLDRATH